MTPDETPQRPAILNAHGRPARTAKDTACPQCGAGPEKRVKSGGFGLAHPCCSTCGFEWHGEVFRG